MLIESKKTLLQNIQNKLLKLYNVDTVPCITQYLVDKDTLEDLNLYDRPQLIIHKTHNDISLGVYLGDKERFEEHADLNDLNVYAYLVEEISHFNYLFWNIKHERPCSLLDIEVQGEIDKFLILADEKGFSRELIKTLFGKYMLRGNLTQEEKTRYHFAHTLGKALIQDIFRQKLKRKKILDFLRVFYRKGSVRRINELSRLKS